MNAGGSGAADRSPHGRTARYHRIATHGLPGALPGNPGSAVATEDGRVILGPDRVTSPTTYSVELWFRTTSSATGYLAGFESSTLGLSSQADRTLLIEDGHLVFGDWPAWVPRLISSPTRYDDGAWHHVVVTSAGRQSVLYVDGVRVAAGETSAVSAYLGYWRVGGGSIGFFSGLVSSFVGELDNVAVYPTALSEQRVAAHWAAR